MMSPEAMFDLWKLERSLRESKAEKTNKQRRR